MNKEQQWEDSSCLQRYSWARGISIDNLCKVQKTWLTTTTKKLSREDFKCSQQNKQTKKMRRVWGGVPCCNHNIVHLQWSVTLYPTNTHTYSISIKTVENEIVFCQKQDLRTPATWEFKICLCFKIFLTLGKVIKHTGLQFSHVWRWANHTSLTKWSCRLNVAWLPGMDTAPYQRTTCSQHCYPSSLLSLLPVSAAKAQPSLLGPYSWTLETILSGSSVICTRTCCCAQ